MFREALVLIEKYFDFYLHSNLNSGYLNSPLICLNSLHLRYGSYGTIAHFLNDLNSYLGFNIKVNGLKGQNVQVSVTVMLLMFD